MMHVKRFPSIHLNTTFGQVRFFYFDQNGMITLDEIGVIAIKSSAENVNYFIYIKKIKKNYVNYFRNSKSIIVLF
jgi:hypothetical protein